MLLCLVQVITYSVCKVTAPILADLVIQKAIALCNHDPIKIGLRC